MVRLIMGMKGSGKTKQLIELINNAAKDEPGNVVFIEANRNMTYDIHYHIRLIDAHEYKLGGYDLLQGFISGLHAGNYDISHMFIDNFCKIVGKDVDGETETFLNWLDSFGERNNIKFSVTVRADAALPVSGPRNYGIDAITSPRPMDGGLLRLLSMGFLKAWPPGFRAGRCSGPRGRGVRRRRDGPAGSAPGWPGR